MKQRRLSHAIGFDDCPFDRSHRGDVGIVGAVFSNNRLDGILMGKVRRDGANSSARITRMIEASRFSQHLHLIMLQGIALAGFNVVDVFSLHRRTGLPILVVARRKPDLQGVREALITRVSGGQKKWRIIERLGAMEPIHNAWVQRIDLSLDEAADVIGRFAIHGSIPEPLRIAHLVAGGIGSGESRGRV